MMILLLLLLLLWIIIIIIIILLTLIEFSQFSWSEYVPAGRFFRALIWAV